MFHFFKKKKTVAEMYDHLPVTTDIHSHILPGIDDGSPDMTPDQLAGLPTIGNPGLDEVPGVVL